MRSGSLLDVLAIRNDTVNIGQLTVCDWALSECFDETNTICDCHVAVDFSFYS